MEEKNALGDKFQTIQELLDKEEFTAAFEMLDSLYKEYSSIEWVEDDEPSSVDNEQQQALHYLYKYSYAQQLIGYYCQLFTALIPLLNEAVKYKDDIVAAYSHVDNILEELDALEKAAPGELSRQSLQLYRSDYKTVRAMLSDCCGLSNFKNKGLCLEE